MCGDGEMAQKACSTDYRTSEQVMVDMIRQDLGVVIDPQAWRMFVRHRFDRIAPLAHRIHDGKS
jgi:hypothetical protein